MLVPAKERLLASGGLAQRLGQVVIMTQRKCDFILTLMLGLQVRPSVSLPSRPPNSYPRVGNSPPP